MNVGACTTVGDQILRSALARSTYGVNGQGVRVGIISDGVDHWTSSRDYGDLPSTFQVLNNRYHAWYGGYYDEGTAMSEIVYDIAPGASLSFSDAGNSEASFNSSIDALINAGCNVIVDDIIYLSERMFEDGAIAQHVDQVTASGVRYISSAWNQATDTWDAQSVDANKNNWMEFSGSDETNAITVPPASQSPYNRLRVVLQWANQYYKSADGCYYFWSRILATQHLWYIHRYSLKWVR